MTTEFLPAAKVCVHLSCRLAAECSTVEIEFNSKKGFDRQLLSQLSKALNHVARGARRKSTTLLYYAAGMESGTAIT